MLTHILTAADHATRVRIDTNSVDSIQVVVGSTSETWPDGCYIEVVNLSPSPIELIGTAVTLTSLSGTTFIQHGEYARVSLVSPGQWDMHVYTLDGYLFQVGVPASGHIHYASLTSAQAKTLIHGTNSQQPVASGAQPSVVITTEPNSNNPAPTHIHALTVYFDYVAHTFVVTNITNNASDNHVASLVGGGGSAAEPLNQIVLGNNTELTSSPLFSYDEVTGGFNVNHDPIGVDFAPSVPNSANVVINSAHSALGDGGNIYIASGQGVQYGNGIDAKGGDIEISVGPGSTYAGNIVLRAGVVNGPNNHEGGNITLIAGGCGGLVGEFGDAGGNVWVVSGTPFIGSGVAITGGTGGEGGSPGMAVNGRGSLGFGAYNGFSVVTGFNYGGAFKLLESRGPTSPPQWVDPVFKPAPMEVFNDSRTAVDFGCAQDHNMHYRMNAATQITITVQPDSFWPDTSTYYNPGNGTTSPMPQGGSTVFGKRGTGDVVFVAGAGVTINTPAGLSITKLNGKATLMKVATNEYDLEGNLT
jgi:hypothetical protein